MGQQDIEMGQQDIVGQVLSVQGRPINSGKTIYEIAFGDGNTYVTFKGQLAEKANALKGQQASARVTVKQKGDFTNYYLDDIAPQGSLAPIAMPVAGGTAITMHQNASVPQGIPMAAAGDPEKDARIAKAVAVKAAVEFVGALFQGAGPEALSEALEAFDKTGQHIYGVLTGTQAEAQVVPAAQTPDAVAAAVNDAAGGEVVQTGAAVPWQ